MTIINDHDPRTPLFLYLAEQAPHGPINCPKSYTEHPYLPEGSKRDAKFAGTLAAADDRFKTILDALTGKGMLANTIIIFSSDNGGPIGSASTGSSNYPLRGAKHTLFEGGVRVGGFVWSGTHAPQVKKGSFRGLIHATDWFPTLMHLVGNEDSVRELDGVNQWDALASGTPVRDAVFIGGMNVNGTFSYAVRTRNWKLIFGSPGLQKDYVGWSSSDGQTMDESLDDFAADSYLLYDLNEDQREQTDVAASQPSIVDELKAIGHYHVINMVSHDHATDASCPMLEHVDGDPLLPWC